MCAAWLCSIGVMWPQYTIIWPSDPSAGHLAHLDLFPLPPLHPHSARRKHCSRKPWWGGGGCVQTLTKSGSVVMRDTVSVHPDPAVKWKQNMYARIWSCSTCTCTCRLVYQILSASKFKIIPTYLKHWFFKIRILMPCYYGQWAYAVCNLPSTVGLSY